MPRLIVAESGSSIAVYGAMRGAQRAIRSAGRSRLDRAQDRAERFPVAGVQVERQQVRVDVVGRLELERAPQVRLGIAEQSPLRQHDAQVAVRDGEGRVGGDRFAQDPQPFVEAPCLEDDHAEVRQCAGVVRLCPQELAQQRFGARQVAGVPRGDRGVHRRRRRAPPPDQACLSTSRRTARSSIGRLMSPAAMPRATASHQTTS